MYKRRIKRLEERIEALEKALVARTAEPHDPSTRNEPDESDSMSGSSELDWDVALERIKEANRSDENQS